MGGANRESVSGIHADENGDRVIGGSVRADGTVRKTVKVRPGFTPKEDVKRYDVRERMRQRQEEREIKNDETNDDVRKPGGRPNRQFGVINNILQSNSQPQQPKIDEKQVQHDSKKSNIETTELESSFDKLSLGSKESSPQPLNKLTTSTKESTSSKPKKYVPPSRRKKYTLADLDNSQ